LNADDKLDEMQDKMAGDPDASRGRDYVVGEAVFLRKWSCPESGGVEEFMLWKQLCVGGVEDIYTEKEVVGEAGEH
jgi:hypothetical protein